VPGALEHLGLPAFAISEDGTIVWNNEAMRALFGDLVGKHYLSPFASESRHAAETAFVRKVIGQTRATDYPATVVRSDGVRIAAEVSSVAIESDHHIAGVFGVVDLDRPLPEPREPATPLTPRQAQVLRELAQGASTPQIATTLALSPQTVRNHVRDLLRALGVHSRLEAVVAARRLGLV
jgi:PAS domain S-box-containing protein